MMKTEAEAKECWCPFARVSATFSEGYGFSYNRSLSSPVLTGPCIASGCMAWRQVTSPIPNPADRQESIDAAIAGRPQPIIRVVSEEARGYCGLAGRPIGAQ